MTRKVYAKITVCLIINVEEGVDVQELIDEMDYNFKSTTENADIADMSIEEFEIVDSK